MKKIAVKDIKNRIAAVAKGLPGIVKGAPAKLKAWYKRFLYAEKKEKTSFPKRTSALILSLVLIVLGLYYMGVFDFDLIERPESWKGNAERLFSIWQRDDASENGEDGNKEDDKKEPSDAAQKEPEKVPSVVLEFKGRSRRPGGEGAGISTVFKTREELAGEGYYLTDRTFDPASSVIGQIKFSYSLPSEFSYRNMQTRSWVITRYDDGQMSTAEDTEITVERPAVYLYMGNIIFDDRGKALYIVDRNGTVTMNYNENYLPAFERDANGNPLFYTNYSYYAEVPASSEFNKYGEEEFTYKTAYVSGKNYYTLSYGGNYFVGSDFIEERDGRGLCYDYTSDFGLPDSNKQRVGIMEPKFSTFLDGKSALVNFMHWNYFDVYDPEKPDLTELLEKLKEQEEKKAEEIESMKEAESAEATSDTTKKDEKAPDDKKDGETTGNETKEGEAEPVDEPEEIKLEEILPYPTAYNYSEGYATVVTDKEVDEEAKFEVKELRVINAYGDIMFASRKRYQNKILNAYCSDRFLLPLSKGEESIGSLYFDRGYMRLRKVSYDPFQLKEFKVFRVNMDSDVLVDPYGKEFPIPEGYTLKGYSDGILTLERNGVYGYMNVGGTWISEPMYKNAAAFHGGVGVLTRRDGTVGAVDVNGTIIIPFRYSYISNRSDELIAAYSEKGGWELFGVFTK